MGGERREEEGGEIESQFQSEKFSFSIISIRANIKLSHKKRKTNSNAEQTMKLLVDSIDTLACLASKRHQELV